MMGRAVQPTRLMLQEARRRVAQDRQHSNLHRRSGIDPPQLPEGIRTWRDAISAINDMIAVRKVEIARLQVMSKAFRQAAALNTPYPKGTYR